MTPIASVARELGVNPDDVIPWGRDAAKISLSALGRPARRGRLILMSAMTPTPAGEGKTTMSIALAQGLKALGERACVALREPSIGPTFGRKGGATGGGRATLVPADTINLHFTGDFHAITSAHNLLAALLDNHLHHGNTLGLDVRRILWGRVLDMNDRALRHVVVGLGGPTDGVPRQSGFDITAASEVMAALCLADDHDDLAARLRRIVVGLRLDGAPVTADALGAVGGMMVLLRDALLPNLVQTGEGVPALVHGGPFANIAHGCNSVVATRLALGHADWAVTEAGFGFDLGGEKFFDLKCVSAGLDTAAVVLVATVRALKRHGGVALDDLDTPRPDAVAAGLPNLLKHVENILTFGEAPVVAMNRFAGDTDAELDVVRAECDARGLPFAVCDGYETGGAGAVELAETVMAHAERRGRPFTPLYDWTEPIKRKLDKVARTIYGAGTIVWEREAEQDLAMVHACGGEHLPICVAKTEASLSDDPALRGRPDGFELTVNRLILAAGAGYVVPVLGSMRRMPGLPRSPQAVRMGLVNGRITGVS